ncbi:MAG: hypothetical protein WCO02_08575 [Bacteroidota bacterium]
MLYLTPYLMFDGNCEEAINFYKEVLGFDDAALMEQCFNKLAAGGTVTMQLQDTFWGDRFGTLTDKFGFSWMFNCPLKKQE